MKLILTQSIQLRANLPYYLKICCIGFTATFSTYFFGMKAISARCVAVHKTYDSIYKDMMYFTTSTDESAAVLKANLILLSRSQAEAAIEILIAKSTRIVRNTPG
jgi:hypothetical protein